MNMLERAALWYLRKQGYIVLSRFFVGFAIGNCFALKVESDASFDTWSMITPKDSKIIALNSSVVQAEEVKS